MTTSVTEIDLPESPNSDGAGLSLDPRDHAAALFWGAMLLGVSPFLIKYCGAMWSQDLYQYFPFLLVAVAGLAYTRFDHRIWLPRSGWSQSTTLLAIVFLIPAAILQSTWLGAIAFIFLTASFLACLQDKNGTGSLAYLAIPMVMFIRAPLLGTYTVMHRLQSMTTHLSSIFLDVFGVIHVKSGHTIELISKNLFVAEACSGVQSLFTMCFLSLLILVVGRRSIYLTPLYLALAFFFAIVGNTIRVTSIGLAEDWFRLDLSEGIPHELVGYAALAIAAGTLFAFDHLIGLIGKGRSPVLGSEAHGTPPTKCSTTIFSLGKSLRSLHPLQMGLVVISLVCGGVMMMGHFLQEPDVRHVVATDQILFEPSPRFLDAVDAPIQVVSHRINRDAHGDRNARHGMNSDVWSCGIDSHRGQFVLSQPYMGWHELTICYQVQDWKMTGRQTVLPSGFREPIVVADFVSNEGMHGCLIFTAVNSDGRVPRTPGHSPYARILAPFYPLVMDDFAETSGSAQTLMLQYWMTEKQPISDAAKASIIAAMAKIRQHTSEEVVRKQ